MPKVIVSETEPGEGPLRRVAAELTADSKFSLALKRSRADLIEALRNSREVPMVWQEVILAEIAAIHPKHDLLRLDLHRQAHGGGVNCIFTVKEI